MKKFLLLAIIAVFFASCSTMSVVGDDVYGSSDKPVVYQKVPDANVQVKNDSILVSNEQSDNFVAKNDTTAQNSSYPNYIVLDSPYATRFRNFDNSFFIVDNYDLWNDWYSPYYYSPYYSYYGYRPYGYYNSWYWNDPWYYGSSYSYWNGYNDGYWDGSYYGYNGYYGYNDYYGNNNYRNNTSFGHRGSIALGNSHNRSYNPNYSRAKENIGTKDANRSFTTTRVSNYSRSGNENIANNSLKVARSSTAQRSRSYRPTTRNSRINTYSSPNRSIRSNYETTRTRANYSRSYNNTNNRNTYRPSNNRSRINTTNTRHNSWNTRSSYSRSNNSSWNTRSNSSFSRPSSNFSTNSSSFSSGSRSGGSYRSGGGHHR